MKYLCEWNPVDIDTQGPTTLKIVSAHVANQKFPNLVVSYLESKLDCTGTEYSTAPKRNMTRSLKKRIQNENICLDPKVKIVRNLAMEKTILKNPAGPIIQRRVTFDTRSTKGPTMLKKVSKVPFGARGRKRQTVSIAFIGLQPNPDGRNLAVAGTSALVQTIPARRTYARAKSTPPAIVAQPSSSSSPMVTQPTTVEPDIDLNTLSTRFEDMTLEENSFDSLLGNLHYSSSE